MLLSRVKTIQIYNLYSFIKYTSLTITVWNVVIPGAVYVTVECLDCKSIREPMSYQTGEGHATTRLIQPRRRIQNQRRRIAVTT